MNKQTNALQDNQIFYRLVALWVICEAFAGGIMHGIKLPFTGLIVSSLAVTCIVLIAYYVPSKTAIIKATILVAVFKLMLSPHSPPTAYIAVFFQGLMGQLLFLNKRFFKLKAVILAVLALVESAIQRLLVLVIVYGNEFWKAVNQFIQKITDEKTMTNYSLLIAGGYILIHAVIGIFTGVYAAGLAKKAAGWRTNFPELMIPLKGDIMPATQTKKKKNIKIKLLYILIWLTLLALFIQAYLVPDQAIIALDKISGILLRSFLIVLSWYLLIAPLVMLLIKKILLSEQQKKKQDIGEVMKLIPQTKYIFIQSWKLSEPEKGIKRLTFFLKVLLINVLTTEKI